MKALLSTLAAAVIVTPAVAATVTSSGLHGVVLRGPTTPVCLVGASCSKPVPHVRVTFTDNAVAKTVTTDDAGRYSVVLPSGTYTVRIALRGQLTPSRVHVTAGLRRLQNIEIDSGIR